MQSVKHENFMTPQKVEYASGKIEHFAADRIEFDGYGRAIFYCLFPLGLSTIYRDSNTIRSVTAL